MTNQQNAGPCSLAKRLRLIFHCMAPSKARLRLLFAAAISCQSTYVWPQDLTNATAGPQLVYSINNTSVGDLALNSEETLLAVPSGNGADLWKIREGRRVRHFTGLGEQATTVAFSKDGNELAGASLTEIVFWDVVSGEIKNRFRLQEFGINSIRYSADTRYLIVQYASSLALYDLQQRRIVRSSKGPSYFSFMEESPDGQFIAAGTNGAVFVWSSRLASYRTIRLQNRSTDALRPNIAFSADSKKIAASAADGKVEVWDISSGRLERTLTGLNGSALYLAWSPDGATLATLDFQKLSLWDLQTGTVKTTHDARAVAGYMRFLSDGKRLLIGLSEFSVSDGKLRKFGVSTGARLLGRRGEHDNSLLFASSDAASFFALDVLSGTVRTIYQRPSEGYAVRAATPDGSKVLISTGQMVSLIDLRRGTTEPLASSLKEAYAGAISADGSRIAMDTDTTPIIFEANTKHRFPLGGQKNEGVLGFLPDGHRLITESFNKLSLWDAQSGKLLTSAKYNFIGFERQPTEAVFSQDGSLIVGLTVNTKQYTAEVRKTDGLKLIRRLTLPSASSNLAGADFDRLGRSVLIGSFDAQLRRWDLASGTVVRNYAGSIGALHAARFVSDDSRVAATDDEGIKLWDSVTGQFLASIYAAPDGSWLTITPEGFFDASAAQATRNLSIVRGLEVSSVDQVYNALYRPDLVREKLAGDPNGKVKAAAAQLDLDKVMASGMAPKVTITSPASGSSSDTDEVAVEATVADQGGGIGKVEWRINGVTLGLETRGLDRIEGSNDAGGAARIQTVNRKLSLEPGDNRIEVVAYNAKGLIASEPAQISVKWDGAKTASPPKLYVLAVGVNDYYDSRLHLAYAVPDATALAEGFKKAGAGLYAGVEVQTVLDSDVTLTNLDNTFAELSKKVQPRDVFVFFLAGHGKTKNGRYYFLPRDFRYEDEGSIEKAGMGQDKFQAWFAEIPARKSILLYDTCESGSLTGATRGSDVDERLGALNRMARATGRTFLTATTDDAPALEGYRGHGVFTYALLDALDHGDVNKNGLIEVSELADYIDQKVPDYSFEAFRLRQIPQRSIVGNNFALANKAEVLATSLNANSSSNAQSIPAKPTHVVVAPVDVKDTANDSAATITHLAPGTQVRLMQTANGWTLIARDGQKLGYVADNSLLGLQ